MSDEPGLFDLPTKSDSHQLQDMPINDEQVREIREALDRAGINAQEDRKALVNSVVIRKVASLGELRAVEVRRVLGAIELRSVPKSRFDRISLG